MSTGERRARASALTRTKVMEAATRLFKECGFEAVTMREIAAAAGLSTGALFHHTTGKEDLWAQALGLSRPWRPIAWARKDGELMLLLVDYREEANAAEVAKVNAEGYLWPHTPLEDESFGRTIGSNDEDIVGPGEGGWHFAGWNWSQDCPVDGHGTPIGFIPLDEAAPHPRVRP